MLNTTTAPRPNHVPVAQRPLPRHPIVVQAELSAYAEAARRAR